MPTAVHRALPPEVEVRPTLARGRWRVPVRAVGRLRAFAVHDRIVARRLPALADSIDVVHAWPLGALATLQAARRLGIPTVLERPNAHTRFAFETVRAESDRLGVRLPSDHEHAYNEEVLRREELEYELADKLLCPSEFVAATFRDRDVAPSRLARHTYGFDPEAFSPPRGFREPRGQGIRALFVGVCAVRKGLHFALDAWLASEASRTGSFAIAGEILSEYERVLARGLAHPTVHPLGQRSDIADLMRASDVLVLPSIEEGFPLAAVEALGSGAALLVSDACSEACVHGTNGFVHPVGDVRTLSENFTMLARDPALLRRLREGARATAPAHTWTRAGARLLEVYREVAAERRRRTDSRPAEEVAA